MPVNPFLKKNLIDPAGNFLRQGLSPEKLALSLSLGFALGVIPVIGFTTLLCALTALLLRLNMAAIQLINYFVYPLQIILFIPFIKAGEWIAGARPFPFSLQQVVEMVRSGWWETVRELWAANLLGVMAWVIIVGPVTAVLYFLLLRVFRKFGTDNEAGIRKNPD